MFFLALFVFAGNVNAQNNTKAPAASGPATFTLNATEIEGLAWMSTESHDAFEIRLQKNLTALNSIEGVSKVNYNAENKTLEVTVISTSDFNKANFIESAKGKIQKPGPAGNQ